MTRIKLIAIIHAQCLVSEEPQRDEERNCSSCLGEVRAEGERKRRCKLRTARFDADAATIPGLDDPVATREASVIHRPRMHARVRARSSEDNNI